MKWLPLHLRRQVHMTTAMYKIINGVKDSHHPSLETNLFIFLVVVEMVIVVTYILKSQSHTNNFSNLERKAGTYYHRQCVKLNLLSNSEEKLSKFY